MAKKPLCPLCRAGIGSPVELRRVEPGIENTTFECTNCGESWSRCTSSAF